MVEIRENFSVTVKANYLMTLEQMKNALSITDNESIKLYSEPAEGMDKYPYAMIQIKDTPTTIEMINKPEKTVKFHVL